MTIKKFFKAITYNIVAALVYAFYINAAWILLTTCAERLVGVVSPGLGALMGQGIPNPDYGTMCLALYAFLVMKDLNLQTGCEVAESLKPPVRTKSTQPA